jgi:AcrR family transcriptional regulator
MGRPRQVSDEQILTAMREQVLAQGPRVALDRVADDLGISSPALLKRFGSRKALLLAALKPPENPEWIAALREGPNAQTLEAQLFEMCHHISSFMASVIPCITALRESGISPAEVWKKKGPEEGLRAVQQWLGRARERGLVTVPETDTAAFALLGALQNRAFHEHITQRKTSSRSQRQYLEELARIFTRALAPSRKP